MLLHTGILFSLLYICEGNLVKFVTLPGLPVSLCTINDEHID